MREHGINVPTPTKSANGATLNFKGIDTSSAKYKTAVKACAGKLVAGVKPGVGKLHGKPRIRLNDIHVTGLHFKFGKLGKLHLGTIHIGKIELPAIHIGSVNVPSIKVPTPQVNLGGQSGGEAPTQPKSGGEPES